MEQLFHQDQRLGLQTKGSQWVWFSFFVRCDISGLFCVCKTRKHCVNKACVKLDSDQYTWHTVVAVPCRGASPRLVKSRSIVGRKAAFPSVQATGEIFK